MLERQDRLDFEGSVYDWTFLSDELIKSGPSNLAGAIRGCVNATVFPGDGPFQPHDKPPGLAVLRGSQYQVQVAAVEPEYDFARRHLQHGAFSIDIPRPAQSPMVQRKFYGCAEYLDGIFMHFFGRCEILRLAISD